MDWHENHMITGDYQMMLTPPFWIGGVTMDEKLLAVLQDTVFLSGCSAGEIAKGIGKPYSTLMRECNPYDKGAKLGAMTLFEIMSFTKNVEPLREMAHLMGYELTPRENSLH